VVDAPFYNEDDDEDESEDESENLSQRARLSRLGV
jgi:hypothetical protein